ncbi:Hsp20/alpha crystallin family protein [Candidatus Moduliflexota bacterium]
MMRLVKYAPLRDMWDLEERVNRMFRDIVPRRFHEETPLAGSWEPAVDVYETEKNFVLKAELPEVKEEDVHVNVEGNILTLTGERNREEEIKEDHYHRTERFYGSFTRTFAIPDTVNRDGIKATFKGGVMKLTLPKREEVKPKEIKIEVEK